MTSFAKNINWTPHLIEQDRLLKEKYGQGAHITPASSYQIPDSLKTPEQDTVSFKAKHEPMKQKNDKKMPNWTKAFIVAVATGVGVYAFKKIPAKFKNLEALGLGGKSSHHASPRITDKDRKICQEAAEKLKSNEKFRAKSKYVKDIIQESENRKIIKYADDAPFAEASTLNNFESEGSKWVQLTLKDGKQVGLKYNPNSGIFPPYSTWESGGLHIGLWTPGGKDGGYAECLRIISDGIKAHGKHDSEAIIKELQNLLIL